MPYSLGWHGHAKADVGMGIGVPFGKGQGLAWACKDVPADDKVMNHDHGHIGGQGMGLCHCFNHSSPLTNSQLGKSSSPSLVNQTRIQSYLLEASTIGNSIGKVLEQDSTHTSNAINFKKRAATVLRKFRKFSFAEMAKC